MRFPIVLMVALCAVNCRAQITDDAFGDLFDDMSLQEALDESIAQSKLLVLYVDRESFGQEADARSLECIESARRDRLLRFWLRQHAIMIPLGPEHKELAAKIAEAGAARCSRATKIGDTELARVKATLPVFGVFLNGDLVSAVSACRLNIGNQFGGGIFKRGEANFARNVGVSMNWALFELDFQLDRIKALNPVWFGLHELRNPPLEAEAKTYFSEIEDASADRFSDEIAERPGDVFAVINLARTQAELGDRYGSAATYTWLWERGAERDPDFGPAIRRLITVDVQELVNCWDNYETRFNDMKDAATKRIGTETLDEFADWLRLAAVTGDPLAQLSELDYRINSNYFGSLMPRDERRVLLMIAETECEVMERLGDPDTERDRLRRLLINYEAEKSALAKPELRRLATDQAVLLHARMLEEGLEADARSVAEQAIDRLGPEVGRALVAGALVAGHARSWHRDFLPADGSAPYLAEHLQRALEDQDALSDELHEILRRE
ncbi:MAG: hypothetical protein KDA31_11465 [Phycisphaerales bacterium]|nr:hypothetical protein [Phycisphaerales bacterium]MCB9835952.1 hypothetical protein [Phycisphaera sp.]